MTLPATTGEFDPKGLIREAYRIDGIQEPECRSIFMDWALCVPPTVLPALAIQALHAHYAPAFPDHPMTTVLKAGLAPPARATRRGGWRSRRATPPNG